MVFLLSADYAEVKMVNNGKFRLCNTRSFCTALKKLCSGIDNQKQRRGKVDREQSQMSVLFI